MEFDKVIVLFKRDLRVFDHQPLLIASKLAKEVLPLYVYEPEYWSLEDTSLRHWSCVFSALVDLNNYLKDLGHGLVVEKGDINKILRSLKAKYNYSAIFCHEETGNAWTYDRDKKLRRFCRESNITLNEYPQFGVLRPLSHRNNYSKLAKGIVIRSLYPKVTGIKCSYFQNYCWEKKLVPSIKPPLPVGRRFAVTRLKKFLNESSRFYLGGISSPNKAEKYSSKISVYLSYGLLSMSEVFFAVDQKIKELKFSSLQIDHKYWIRSLNAFKSRLHWHCHFIQKLESEPRIEYENLHYSSNTIRQESFNEEYFKAWCQGLTGYPLVDACMRCLNKTGWINFRMRAMLVSFSSYHLWLHWVRPAQYLARQFVDYEPGIHYCQFQMQSGTTGINAIRIYNPIKQSIDQDPDGEFIRKWVPELRTLSKEKIHDPNLHDSGLNYPSAIVDNKKAMDYARQAVWTIRKSNDAKKESKKIMEKHGSRKKRKEKPVKKNVLQSPLFPNFID